MNKDCNVCKFIGKKFYKIIKNWIYKNFNEYIVYVYVYVDVWLKVLL